MKRRILTAFLAVFMLFCTSCTTLDKASETIGQTEPEAIAKEPKYPTVNNPLTWERIRAIPVANGNMSEEELRQICVDLFRLQLSFEWTPERSFTYTVANSGKSVNIQKGKVYAGNLYVTNARSNVYRVMQYYNPETGIFEIPTKDGDSAAHLIGNQCSFGSFWGWARVSNSYSYTLTNTITPKNGAIPVGPYKSTEGSHFISTKEICKENGREVMYASYAALKKADGTVTFNSSGHVRMVSENAHVEYKKDGSIDGDKSYVLYLDQISVFSTKKDASSTPVYVQGGIDRKASFADMYGSGYLPFTVKELAGLDPVEAGELTVSGVEVSEGMSLKELAKGKIQTNYTISDITTTFTAADGTVPYRYLVGTGELHCFEFELKKAIFPSSVKGAIKGADGTLSVVCRLGTGEEIPIYEGKAVF